MITVIETMYHVFFSSVVNTHQQCANKSMWSAKACWLKGLSLFKTFKLLSFRFAFFIETMDCLLQKGQWSAVAIISYQCKYLEYFNLNPETKVGSRLFDNFFRRWTKTLRLKTLNDIIHPWMNKRQTQTCCKMKRNKKEKSGTDCRLVIETAHDMTIILLHLVYKWLGQKSRYSLTESRR